MNNIFQMLKASGNPQQFAYNQLMQMSNNNPMIAQAINNPGNAEQIVRNICKEKNINIDTLMGQIRQFIG